MNKEQIIDEAYENYVNWWEYDDNSVNLSDKESEKWLKLVDGGLQWAPLTKEEFINKCKTNPEFSERWELQIEERELSLEERKSIYENEYTKSVEVPNNHWLNSKLTTRNIPTKLITITYKDETIESYES